MNIFFTLVAPVSLAALFVARVSELKRTFKPPSFVVITSLKIDRCLVALQVRP